MRFYEMNEKSKLPKKAKKTQNKRLIIVLTACVAVMLLLMFLNSLNFDIDMSGWFGGVKEAETSKIRLVEPDYEENIFENESYMEKNRAIMYTDGGITSMISSSLNEYGFIGEFFLSYFDTVVNGDVAAYSLFLTESYKEDKNNKIPDMFTMQMIYDIEIERTSETKFDSGEYEGTTRYTFKVAYKIMRNNGTFRADMPSDTAVPVIIEVLSDKNGMKINSIVKNKLITE